MARLFKKQLSKKVIFIIVSAIIVLMGLGCFVLAYGIAKGWLAVALWFTSKYALLLYIFLGLYIVGVIGLTLYDVIKRI